VVIGGNGAQGGSSNNLMEGLMAILLSERVGAQLTSGQQTAPRKPEVEALRNQIQQGLMSSSSEGDGPAPSITT
jgi:hypothetical protein